MLEVVEAGRAILKMAPLHAYLYPQRMDEWTDRRTAKTNLLPRVTRDGDNWIHLYICISKWLRQEGPFSRGLLHIPSYVHIEVRDRQCTCLSGYAVHKKLDHVYPDGQYPYGLTGGQTGGQRFRQTDGRTAKSSPMPGAAGDNWIS